jgi:hypothetical protein
MCNHKQLRNTRRNVVRHNRVYVPPPMHNVGPAKPLKLCKIQSKDYKPYDYYFRLQQFLKRLKTIAYL